MSRLKELIERLCPDGVEYKSLKSIASFGGGKTPSKKDPTNYEENGRNWVTSKDVKTMVIYKTGVTISEKGAKGMTIYPAGAIVMVTRSGILQKYLPIAILGDESTVNQDIKVILAGDSVLPKYLLYALQSRAASMLSKYHKAGTVDSVDFDRIKEEPIPVPPIEVQREIVRILDSMQDLDDVLSEEMESRNTQFEGAIDRIVEKASLGAPETKFGDVASIARGASPRPIKAFMSDASSGIHWVKIGDVPVGGKYITGTKEYVTPEGAAKSRFLSNGSFVLSNSMSFGRPYIMGIDGCIHDGWLSITGYEDAFDKDFLYYLLRSSRVQKHWMMAASSGTVSNLNADIVKDTVIPVPALADQIEGAAKLDTMMECINAIDEELQARRKQFEYYRDKLLDFPEKVG